MSVEQAQTALGVGKRTAWINSKLLSLALIFRVVIIILISFILFRSTVTPTTLRYGQFSLAVAGHGFKLIEWEIDALDAKLQAAFRQPAKSIVPSDQPQLVQMYLERAQQISRVQNDLTGRASGLAPIDDSVSEAELRERLAQLRSEQDEVRPAVEQILQQQVGAILRSEDLALGRLLWPPVQFTFTEPPKKMVVSPRDQITTDYSRMLAPTISLTQIELAEEAIDAERNAAAYITEIGGLGAYPSMVVDRASLRWVVSTVAHEWIHNYLVFFPLGWNYFANQDMTTINESVAEIVGNEVGNRVLMEFYGIEPPPEQPAQTEAMPAANTFDFRATMRETRLEVDRLLALGQIDEAEAYMEAQRQMFVNEGYSLRVLNQAYFAFHGSYVTSPASTSPTGPKLKHLREQMPDLDTFLRTVRDFNSVGDLDDALEAWGAVP